MSYHRVLAALTLAVSLIGCAPGNPKFPWRFGAPGPDARPAPAPAMRPFLMGFTPWPADLSEAGFRAAQEFAHAHGDIVSIMFIGGVPWPEALEGKPFSKAIQENLSYRPPAGKKLFLSISPLDKDRRGLAPYWADQDSLPLPKPWDKERLDSPRVKKAFLNFVLRSVQSMQPNYLAIGVESNVLLSREPAKWAQLKELHRETYAAVKKAHPALPVFFTTEVLHYKKLAKNSKGTDQEREVANLMKHSDLFAMSVYPHMSAELARPIPASFFDFASRFKKPIAVSESGMTSRNVPLRSYGVTLQGSDGEQQYFTELLLKTAARDNYQFVINFATTDFEKLVARLRPPLNEIAGIWAFTGMQTSGEKPKPALAIWDAYLRAKLVRGG
ncbi:MAG: glycosyl hydrolase 53 family protein [Candidatus Binatia bacterium]